MKKTLFLLAIISAITLLPTIFAFKGLEKHNNVIEYFVNPKLDDINFRTFESTNGFSPIMIMRQEIKKNEESKNGIQMEYLFLTGDSVPIYSGMEKIDKNKIEVVKQFLHINNQKIRADKIENNIWYPNSKKSQPITIEFNMKESGYSIKSDAMTFSRFKDTLGQKSFIVELKSIVTTSLNGEELSRMKSDSKRWYVKNKGLVYSGEVTDGKESDYYLVERK